MNSLTRRDLLRSSLALSASTLVAGSVGRAHGLLAGHPGAIRIDADGTAYGAHDPRSDGRAMSVEDEDVDAAP